MDKNLILNILLGIYIILAGLGIIATSFYNSQFIYYERYVPFLPFFPLIYTVFSAWQTEGLKNSIIFAAVVFISTFLFEYFSATTGFLCGQYEYSDILGFKLLGIVPLTIVITWIIMTYPSLIISRIICQFKKKSLLSVITISSLAGLVLTAWDIAMEQMMISKDIWIWEKAGRYFGIPLCNFLGWWLITFVSIAIYLILTDIKEDSNTNPKNVYALYSYAIIGISTVIIDYFNGLGEAALSGLFAIIPWIIISTIQYRKNS